jgi:hypothetical protein
MATTTIKDAPKEHANGSTTLTESIETNVQAAQAAAATDGNTMVGGLRQLPLASLGLVGVLGDETKVVVNKLFLNKLVARGEQVQHDAAQWMKNVQARFR